MKRLGRAEKRILVEEENAAEKFMCDNLKSKGDLQYVNDGKNDLYCNVRWQDMIKMLSRHAIGRLVIRGAQIQEAQKGNKCQTK